MVKQLESIQTLRCNHRHTFEEHPMCFLRNNIIDTRKDTSVPWYITENVKIGYLDIETDGFKANMNTMLTWCIKEKDNDDIRYGVINKSDLFSGAGDSKLTASLLESMYDFDVIASYYGTGFDHKFIRSKAFKYGLRYPEYNEIFMLDLYYAVKGLFTLTSNSLDTVTTYLGIEGKNHISWEAWQKAKYGDPEALGEVLDHNKRDVVILEELHNRLHNYRKWTRKSA